MQANIEINDGGLLIIYSNLKTLTIYAHALQPLTRLTVTHQTYSHNPQSSRLLPL